MIKNSQPFGKKLSENRSGGFFGLTQSHYTLQVCHCLFS